MVSYVRRARHRACRRHRGRGDHGRARPVGGRVGHCDPELRLRAAGVPALVRHRRAGERGPVAGSTAGHRPAALDAAAGITTAGAQALPGSCDRRSALGRRDYALIITLLRLGLRRSEVARLRLDDIDWRAAEVVVRGKGAREDRLPLPVDVGKAIASYLRRGRRAGRDGSRAGASSAAAPKDGRAWRARRTRWTPGPACLPARGGTGRLLGDRAATRSHPNTDGRAYDRE